MKIRLRDIKLFDLDSQTVLQITKFVRHARVQDGISIKLNDPWVVRKVVYHGLRTTDPEMRNLFMAIHSSLNKSFNGNANVPPMPVSQTRDKRPTNFNGNDSAVA